MARELKSEEFLILQGYVDASDRIGYYTQLSDWGYVYADLALGVVNNDSTAGKAANIYLSGYGGEGHIKPSNDQLAQIGLDLMNADFIARQAYPGSAEGQDLTYDIVQRYHNSVFTANHVDVDAWTPNKALNWLSDPAKKQALWNSLLSDSPVGSFASIVAALLDADQPGRAEYLLDLTNAGNSAAFSASNDFGDYSISIPGGGLLVGTGARNQDLAIGSDQNDVLISFMGDDELRGGEGNDRLYGQDGNDRLIGGGGADFLVAGSGDDVVYTGYDDEDTVEDHYDSSDDVVFSGDGNDVVYTTGGSDTIALGKGDDEVHISGAESNVEAPSLTPSRAVLWGGEGADSFYFDKSANVLAVNVDDVTEELLKNMSIDAIFDYFNDPADPDSSSEPYKSYDYILINVDSNDKIFFQGKQITGSSSIAIGDHNQSERFSSIELKALYDRGYFPPSFKEYFPATFKNTYPEGHDFFHWEQQGDASPYAGEHRELFPFGVYPDAWKAFIPTAVVDVVVDEYYRYFQMNDSDAAIYVGSGNYGAKITVYGESTGSFSLDGFVDGLANITISGNDVDYYSEVKITSQDISYEDPDSHQNYVSHVQYEAEDSSLFDPTLPTFDPTLPRYGHSYVVPSKYRTIGTPTTTVYTVNSDDMLKPDSYKDAYTPTVDLSQFIIIQENGTPGDDMLSGSKKAQRFNGGDGNDTVDYSSSTSGISVDLSTGTTSGGYAEGDKFHSIENFIGSAFDDIIIGANNVANVLEGNAGDDLLAGGIGGGDTLIGGAGSDTYDYLRGEGDITIIDTSNNADDIDLIFLSDLFQESLKFYTIGSDLSIVIGESAEHAGDGGSIVIKQFMDGVEGHGIEKVQFGDGTMWDRTSIIAHIEQQNAPVVGTSGDDHIVGTAGNDIIDSLGGNDYVNGGEGSDTYLYSANDGDEYIDDEAGSMTDVDVLKFKDVGYNDVTFSRDTSTSNLLITVSSTQHVITLDEQYYSQSEGWGLEKVQFADGVTVDLQHSDTVWTYHGSSGDDHIVGAIWGKEDIFVGGKGNDYLNGQAGSDTYVYSKGDGSDVISEDVGFTIEEGNTDVLRFTDLNQSDLTFARDGEKLIVAVNGTQDTITVEHQFISSVQDFGVEKIEFADGSSWSLADIWQNVPITGTSTNDTLQGSKYNETLIGGRGNDVMNGGGGNDTYVYVVGDGDDTIIDSANGGDADKLVLSGINEADVLVVSDGSDITLMFNGTASGTGNGGSLIIKDTLNSNSDAGIEQIVFADGTVWNKSDLAAHSVQSGTPNAVSIVGTSGDDHIVGTAGNDIIDSLGGNDYVNGGEGSDTYLYSVNDGDEYIDDEAGSMTDVDVLKFKDVGYNDVTFSRDTSTSNLLITVSLTQHVITLDEQYYSQSEGWGLEKVQFADGVTVDLQHSDTVWTYHGSSGDDHIVGAIWGKEDIFVGGKGNDYLNGQAGSDNYVYSKGDGSDVISEDVGFTIEEGNTDVLRFTDLNQSDLTFARDGEKLIVAVNGTQDTITVEHQFISSVQDFGVEKIEFADGSSWSLADIWQNVPITGTSTNDTLQGSKYNETLISGDGDDTLIGGLGDDYLEGGLGSDTYQFNFGDGHDTIYDRGSTASTEIDRLVFSAGISSSDVTVAIGTNNSDLLLTAANGGGDITLKNQRIDNSGGVDQISFSDGTVWDRSTLLTKAAA
ncbi:hypothetical protein RvVAT039_pl02730 (plasmid) [Agrobacterium vitis]|uniref:calcium-binding protein n=1 Tax=Agrobacterium vitis TaxID=373 RepID=UPI0015D9BDCB|nr:calcium-binding protein [Agrobacterium vitis]BCH67440.1 hypothetical protein RvVAT039_pl02730 [Agrobacterium vitis]